AATGGDDHVHAREQLGISLHAGICEREPGGISADPLPRLHLALVALFRDLLVEVDPGERMDEKGREGLGVDVAAPLAKSLPMRVRPLAEAGHDADAGDPGFARRFSHDRAPASGIRGSLPSSPCWRGTPGSETRPGGT